MDETANGHVSVRDDTGLQDALLFDENAFGIWVSWFDAEEVEYSQSAEKFPPRVLVFRSAVKDFLESTPLGAGARAVDFGTAVYVEVGDGDQSADILKWVRAFREFLAQSDWVTFAVVTHGGRWVARQPSACLPQRVGDVEVLASFGPTEPFRKAMAADSMAHDDDDVGEKGWGSGLFVEADALEAMNRRLKNAPTELRCAGTSYFRVGA
ncbi:MAG: hypothetical protein MUF54_09885 [Polyangiaceae bacterium]|nr:hypothetical protein [Polyangiaceae bacterium]